MTCDFEALVAIITTNSSSCINQYKPVGAIETSGSFTTIVGNIEYWIVAVAFDNRHYWALAILR